MTPQPNWNEITTVLLDMDGTLLDKYFDDYFWQRHLPEAFARRHGLAPEAAAESLARLYRSQELTLNWTDLDYWSRSLGLDIPTLKEEIAHLIALHPTTEEFLAYVQGLERPIYLVTNAHTKTLELKMRKTGIDRYFDGTLCSCEVGFPKEDLRYWNAARARFGFAPESALLVDDDPNVLATAAQFGIRYVVQQLAPSSRRPAATPCVDLAIADFRPLMPRRGA